MKYETINFDHLIGIEGLSEKTLTTHFALYQGYVNNTNKLLDILNQMISDGKSDTSEFAELKRRLGWEFNGMRLHEYYFSGISKAPNPMNSESDLVKKIIEDFGNFENWEKDFRSTASMRGIGWVILYFDPKLNRLMNFWIGEHDEGHPAGLVPILNIDVFEHAFLLDYATKRVDYINAFMKMIDWSEIEKRYISS